MSQGTFTCADPEGGGQGVWTPLKNHKNIGFSSNTGPDPLKITKKATEPTFNVGPCILTLMHDRWRFAGGPMMAPLTPSST